MGMFDVLGNSAISRFKSELNYFLNHEEARLTPLGLAFLTPVIPEVFTVNTPREPLRYLLAVMEMMDMHSNAYGPTAPYSLYLQRLALSELLDAWGKENYRTPPENLLAKTKGDIRYLMEPFIALWNAVVLEQPIRSFSYGNKIDTPFEELKAHYNSLVLFMKRVIMLGYLSETFQLTMPDLNTWTPVKAIRSIKPTAALYDEPNIQYFEYNEEEWVYMNIKTMKQFRVPAGSKLTNYTYAVLADFQITDLERYLDSKPEYELIPTVATGLTIKN